jgi:hypothetical protein
MGKNMSLRLIVREFARCATELVEATLLLFKLAQAAKVKV